MQRLAWQTEKGSKARAIVVGRAEGGVRLVATNVKTGAVRKWVDEQTTARTASESQVPMRKQNSGVARITWTQIELTVPNDKNAWLSAVWKLRVEKQVEETSWRSGAASCHAEVATQPSAGISQVWARANRNFETPSQLQQAVGNKTWCWVSLDVFVTQSAE